MRFGLVAGESSGDVLGAGLIDALRQHLPDAVFEGVAGQRMRAAGCESLGDAERLAVMGYAEPLRRLPELLRLRRNLLRHWVETPPDAFIGIDAPDFNLALERRLKDSGIPTAHYVSPSVWAWRQGRVNKIRAAADTVLCILPFETDFYHQHGVQAVFVGHPTADSTPVHPDTAAARQRTDLSGSQEVVAVLPGSRMSEVTRLAPVFAEACAELARQRDGLGFVLPLATPALRGPVEQAFAAAGMLENIRLLAGDAETAMTAADVVLLASGTAALESALLQKPTVAAYKVSPLTAAIVRAFGMLKVDKFTLPNQLTEQALIPEFIQEAATARSLAQAVAALLDDPARRQVIAGRFAKLRSELALGASHRAAEAILALVHHEESR